MYFYLGFRSDVCSGQKNPGVTSDWLHPGEDGVPLIAAALVSENEITAEQVQEVLDTWAARLVPLSFEISRVQIWF